MWGEEGDKSDDAWCMMGATAASANHPGVCSRADGNDLHHAHLGVIGFEVSPLRSLRLLIDELATYY